MLPRPLGLTLAVLAVLPTVPRAHADCADIGDHLRALGSESLLGEAENVTVSGDYAYVTAFQTGLHILDVSDPEDPRVVGNETALGGWVVSGVVVQGNYAYVAAGLFGLAIIDVTDPAHPAIVGRANTPGAARGVVLGGGYAFVSDDAAGLAVVSVADVGSPSIVGSVDTPGHAYQAALSGSHVYVADKEGGLHVIDVSIPASPVVEGSLALTGQPWCVAVSGTLAYVGGYHPVGFQVVDITDPHHPQALGGLPTSQVGPVLGIHLDGTRAYVAGYGLEIIDLSNPAAPVFQARLRPPHGSRGVDVRDGFAYVTNGWAGEDDFFVIALGDVWKVASVTATGDLANDVTVRGDFAYVANGGGGLLAVDIADPLDPQPAGAADTPGWAMSVAISGAHAFVADAWGGLSVVDITAPASPQWVGGLDTGYPSDVAVAGDLAFLAGDNLEIVDVSDPADPRQVGAFLTPDVSSGVAISGHYAYVSGGAGMRVLDISDPGSPVMIAGPVATPYADAVVLSGNLAYVVGNAFDIVDVSVPENAHTLSSLPIEGKDVCIRDGLAYVAGDWSSVALVDITNPLTPRFVTSIDDTLGATSGVDIVGDRLVLSSPNRGLLIAPAACGAATSAPGSRRTSEGRALAAFPNPFTESVVIRFDARDRVQSEVAIYDVGGRLVRRLVGGSPAGGSLEFAWDGRDARKHAVSPGVYLARAIGGDRRAYGRITRVR